jgi:hypothetical protein
VAAYFILICVRGDLVVHGMHGESIVCRWEMGGYEDDGVIDEEGAAPH